MTERVTHATVEFAAPFILPGFEAPLPAGAYNLMTEHEVFDVSGYTVHRRTATILRVPIGARVEHHPIDPSALEAALKQDRENSAREAERLRDVPIALEAIPALEGKAPWRSIPKWVRVARSGFRN